MQRPVYLEDLDNAERRALIEMRDGAAVKWRGGFRIRGKVVVLASAVVARLIGMGVATAAPVRGADQVSLNAEGRSLARRLAEQAPRFPLGGGSCPRSGLMRGTPPLPSIAIPARARP